MRLHLARLPRLSSRLALCVVLAGMTGCSAGVRPDAKVGAIVEREDRRVAAERAEEMTALAAADLAPLELASAGAALQTLGLLYVPDPRPRPAARTGRVPTAADDNPNWVQGPPPSWLGQPWPDGSAMDADAEDGGWRPGASWDSAGDGPSVSSDGVGGGRRGGGKRKPKLRKDLMNFHIRGRPVSFSGSLKGLKGVQFKATIKM